MWAIYAFLSAFFVATTDPIAKRNLKADDEYVVGWMLLAVSSVFLGVYYFFYGTFRIGPGLVATLLAIIPLEILASILYYRALKLTDISLSVPFLALTPVFVVLTGFLVLGERVSPAGTIGIVLIAIGVYSLNIKEAKYGWTTPIRAIFLNRGSVYMLAVAFVFSVSASVSKRVMLLSSPEQAPFIYNFSIAVAMAPIIVYRLASGRSVLSRDRRSIISYAALGLFAALSSIFFFKSMSCANVAYAISIKRLSLLISVGYGWLFFRERDVHIRLVSTVCMVLGIGMILICR